MTLKKLKLKITSRDSNISSLVLHFGFLLHCIAGAGEQLLDAALWWPRRVWEELGQPGREIRNRRRRHRLLFRVLEVLEGAEHGQLLLLAATLDRLGLRLQQVDGLAALLCKNKRKSQTTDESERKRVGMLRPKTRKGSRLVCRKAFVERVTYRIGTAWPSAAPPSTPRSGWTPPCLVRRRRSSSARGHG